MRYLSRTHPGFFKNKRVLLRADFNIENPKDPNGLFRLEATIPTIKKLLRGGAKKIIILSHRGRPSSSEADLSLRPLAPLLAKRLNSEVDFALAENINKIKKIIKSSRAKIILLENLRFFAGEESNDPKFARAIASLGDIYINDAFAVSHRKNASIVAITRFLPSYVGLLLEKEMASLNRVRKVEKRPFVLIVAGAKTADKIGVLKYFAKKADYILLGGGPANTFLRAAGVPVDSSLYDPRLTSFAGKLLRNRNIILPVDSLGEKNRILDIGPATERLFSKIISKSKLILWNGPMGQFEIKRFSSGTGSIWRAILKNHKACVVVGGGETVASAKLITNNLKLLTSKRKNIFVSTGGGAMLDYLAGNKLSGIEVLNHKK